MKNLFTTNVGSHTSTSKLFKFLFLIFLVILPMIVVWVVGCEFNEVGLNWMVPVGGKFFINEHLWTELHNNVTPWNDLPALANGPNFVNWIPLVTKGKDAILDPVVISEVNKIIPDFGKYPIVSGWPFLIMCLILVADVLITIVLLFFTRLVFLDIYPSLISTWLVMFLMVVCLIMPWNRLGMTIPVTIIVMVVGWVGSFIILNAIFNQIILHTPYASLYYTDLVQQEQSRQKIEKPYRAARGKFQGEDLDVVEVEEKKKRPKKE